MRVSPFIKSKRSVSGSLIISVSSPESPTVTFTSDPGKIVYKLVAAMIQAPFIDGLVRGIVTKDYKVSAYTLHLIRLGLIHVVFQRYISIAY